MKHSWLWVEGTRVLALFIWFTRKLNEHINTRTHEFKHVRLCIDGVHFSVKAILHISFLLGWHFSECINTPIKVSWCFFRFPNIERYSNIKIFILFGEEVYSLFSFRNIAFRFVVFLTQRYFRLNYGVCWILPRLFSSSSV